MVLKNLSDNLDKLDASVKTLTTTIDAFIAGGGGVPGSATPEEQQAIADRVALAQAQVDADNAKFPAPPVTARRR